MKTEVISFVCPECSTTLRIKNRSFIDRSFNCPECQAALKVTTNDRNILQIQRDGFPPHPCQTKKQASPPLTSGEETITPSNSWRMPLWLQTPLAIGGVAGIVVVSISVMTVWLISKPSVPTPSAEHSPAVASKENQTEQAVKPVITEVKSTPASQPKSPSVKIVHPVIAKIPQQLEPVIAQLPEPLIPPFPATQPPLKPEPIDIAAKLSQRFVKFDQSKPVTLQQFLFQFEELLGVPVEIDESIKSSDASPLTRTLSFQMQEGTLRDLLKTALEKLNLTHKIEPTLIRILKKVDTK